MPPLPASWGWYVRGDLGGYWGTMGGAQSAPGFPSPTDNSIDNGFVGGVGAGFKAGWVRSDVTVDYTAMKYSGTIATPGDVSAKVDAVTALFNGYLDLGAWYGLTPYAGAPLGVFREASAIAPFAAGDSAPAPASPTCARTIIRARRRRPLRADFRTRNGNSPMR